MTFLDAFTAAILLGAAFYWAAQRWISYVDGQKQPTYRYVWQGRREL